MTEALEKKDDTLPVAGSGQTVSMQMISARGDIFRTGSKNIAPHGQDPVWRDVYAIDITGLQRMNQVAGCTVVDAPSISWDGKEVGNPYIVRDERGNALEVVSRVVCYGFSRLGSPAISVSTVNLRVADYEAYVWMNAWAGKLKKGKVSGADRAMGELVAAFPTEAKKDPKKKIVDMRDGTWLVVDITNEKAIQILKQLQAFRTSLVQRARTKATRIAMQRHPAFGIQTLVGDNQPVEVVGWTMTPDRKKALDSMKSAITAGMEGDVTAVQGVNLIETATQFSDEEEAVRELGEDEVTVTKPEEESAQQKEPEQKKGEQREPVQQEFEDDPFGGKES